MSDGSDARLSILREKARALTRDPGVYLMKAAGGRIVYVGKAKSLRNRVSSYFVNIETADAKTRRLVSEVQDFDTIAYNNELEAFLAERTLIKHHRPKYNILLTDDKEYPFVRLHLEEEWPRFQKVRRMKSDGAQYVGPFASGHSLNVAMRVMYRIFPLIRCSPHEFRTAKRPCNYYHMKQCLGPCTLPVPRQEYLALVRRALDFLKGNNAGVVNDLNRSMREAAQREDFETAAACRDQIEALRRIEQRQSLISSELPEADVIGLVRWGDEVCIHVTAIRNHVVAGGDNFFLVTPLERDDCLAHFLLQYYDQKHIPVKIILPYLPSDADQLRALLHRQREVEAAAGGSVDADATLPGLEFMVPDAGGQAGDLLSIAQKNAAYALEGKSADKKSIKVELEVLREFLGLAAFPRLIECIDISNFQGGSVVAAKVCFQDGKPFKDRYRRYEVQSLGGKPDDFQSMREVVGRRLEKGLADGDLPDLLVIDGGRGQLSAALEAMAKFPGLGLEVIGLAKKKMRRKALRFRDEDLNYQEERVYRRGEGQPVVLSPGSVPYRILTRIRDEAHRFAITYHRSKRQKVSMASALDAVPGIGKVLKARLLKRFGTMEMIRGSSVDDLVQVPGVSEKLAQEIVARLAE